jgi:hypothetical protein
MYKDIYKKRQRIYESQSPDYISPLIGYRVWSVNEANLLGACAHSNDIWIPLEVKVAECKNFSGSGYSPYNGITHDIPNENCSCGIYAFKEFNNEMLGNAIIGEVYLWGKIVPHKHGWRAQFAYPKRFYRRQYMDKPFKLSEIYHVPTIEFIRENKYIECYDIDSYRAVNVHEQRTETENQITYTNVILLAKCSICRINGVGQAQVIDGNFVCHSCYERMREKHRVEIFQHLIDHQLYNRVEIFMGRKHESQGTSSS